MNPEFETESLAGLNAAQREAVLHFEGPMLVLAGAGSGKTRVLTTRIARLVEHHGVDPTRILSVTFTNKAAGEMRDRISRLLGHEPKGMWCGTFHAIGARLLRANAAAVGRAPNFTIYDEDDSIAVIKRVMEAAGISTKAWSAKAIASLISDAKNALVSPEEYATLALDPVSRNASVVYRNLEVALRNANAVTFDDLLTLPVQLLSRDEGLRHRLGNRFQFILVDEYQDTNRAQYQFIKLLGAEHSNVVVVGDDDQSIYGWRGADIRNILDFEREFPTARVVRLEENYRSTPNILEVANAAISANVGRKGKTLRPTLPAGERATVVATLDDRDEADWVVEEIMSRMSSENRSARDFAVLYRTNAQSRSLEDALRKHTVPYRLVGAVRFYDRREIRDLMAYLKLIANPADDEAFRRAVAVPKRGLGDTTIETLAGAARGAGIPMLAAASLPDLVSTIRPAARAGLGEFADLIGRFREMARESSVDELLRDLVDTLRFGDYLRADSPEQARDRIENVSALIDGAVETVVDYGGEIGLTPLDHFLQRAMLVAGTDQLDPSADAVTLMTMHNAKGLEYPVVFITGIEDGLFPTSQSFDDPAKLEEERRLFYVGITRAEQKLYLTHSESRRRNGEIVGAIPSRFLRDIPAGMLEERGTMRAKTSGRHSWTNTSSRKTHAVPEWRSAKRDWAAESQDEPAYVPGERVRHTTFGTGTISEIGGTGRDVKATITFDDEEVGNKTIKLAYTKLERE
ncbi:MAG: UvrD-helicase domain-containing protein [Gemmatimonadaceae bacterium]